MKKISKKNYVTYGIIVILCILFLLYLNSWYKAYKEEELANSYISKYIGELSYNEFNNYIKENSDFIIYMGKKNCEECVSLEKNMYKIVKNNNLKDNFIFLNISNNLEKFNSSFNTDIKVVPNILIVNNKQIIDYIDLEENSLIRSDLVDQILEENGYINQ